MPNCKICGKELKAETEYMTGFSFPTRLWGCDCGYKRSVIKKSEHDEWELIRKTQKKVEKPQSNRYNYIHCLDKPDTGNQGIKSKKERCNCDGNCGNDCKCGEGGCSAKKPTTNGCSGGGCTGCK